MSRHAPRGLRALSAEALTFGRQSWRALVSEFRAGATEALAEGRVRDERALVMRGALRRAGGTLGENSDRSRRVRMADLPVEGSSAGPARDAFTAAATGFLIAGPDRRPGFARLLLAACDLVDGLLDAEGQAVADRTWRRQFPEE